MCILLAGAGARPVWCRAWTRTATSAGDREGVRLARIARGLAGGGQAGAARHRARRGEDPAAGEPARASRARASTGSSRTGPRCSTRCSTDWEAKNTGAFVEACEAYAETITEGDPEPHRRVPRRGGVRAAARLRRARLGAPVGGGDGAGQRRRRAAPRGDPGRCSSGSATPATTPTCARGPSTSCRSATSRCRCRRAPRRGCRGSARYVEIYSGRSPTASEMARFHARLEVQAA